MNLKTDYKNISWTGLRKYEMIDNGDGTVSFRDVTEYSNVQDSNILAQVLNTANDAINRMMNGEIFYTEAEVDALLQLKQNLLTFDDAPTSGSNNPVKSSGIKSSFDAVNTRIDNLSVFSFHICTSGEYDPVTGQPTIQNPDTSTFYLVPTGSSPDVFTEWVYINNAWEKFGSTTVDLSNYVTTSDFQDALDDKQDVLTFDSTPTENSDNPVTSDGIYDALSGKSDTGHNHDSRYYTESEIDTLLAGKSDVSHNHDSRYYTESEVDTLLSGKSDTSSTYTSAQVDTLLSAKVDNTSIGSMAAEDDAPSDHKIYGRSDGDWEEVTGGGSSYAEKTFYVNPSSGSDTNDGTSAHPFQTVQHAIDEGSNLGFTIINIPGNITENITIAEKTIYINYTEHNKTFTGNISISNRGYLEFIGNGMSYTITGDIEIIENSNLRFGKESVTVSGTISLVDSYLSAYSELTVSTQVSERKTGITADGASQVSINMLTVFGYRGVEVRKGAVAFIGTLAGTASTQTRTVGGYIFVGSKAGQFYNKEDVDGKLLLKADINDLGTMSYIDDAPSDGGEYVRKNGNWAEASGGGGTWGSITGTLSDQSDLQSALDDKTDLSVIASDFSTSTSYTAGEFVVYDGKLYVFSSAHAAGAWSYADAYEVKVSGVLQAIDNRDDFKITGSVSNGGYTLTDARIDSEHWEVDWVIFSSPSMVTTDITWSTDIVNHTVTLTATYSGSTNVIVNMHWVQ